MGNVNNQSVRMGGSAHTSSPGGADVYHAPSFHPPGTLTAEDYFTLECLAPEEGEITYQCYSQYPNGTVVASTHAVKITGFKVDVTNIKFNHDTAAHTNDAINIRKGYGSTETYDISQGEWVMGRATNHPACYTANVTPTVKAKLTVVPSTITNVTLYASVTNANPVLKDLVATNVVFSSGVSVGATDEYVELSMASLIPAVIRKSQDTWKWKATAANGQTVPETAFSHTGSHTVYTILSEPQAPWNNAANSQQNVWVSALDFAIVNANCEGATTAHDALVRITQHLHAKASAGGHGLTYDTNGGAPAYAKTLAFDFTGYMAKSSGSVVNCYDQAGGVYVLSRLLGISSEFVYMGRTYYSNGKPPFGYIRATHLVGVTNLCNNPFFTNTDPYWSPVSKNPLLDGGDTDKIMPDRTLFGNHAFVRQSSLIFDACAGPHLGTENLVQYATASIDISSLPEREWSPDGTGVPFGESWGGNTNGVFSTTEVDNAVDAAQQMVQGVK